MDRPVDLSAAARKNREQQINNFKIPLGILTPSTHHFKDRSIHQLAMGMPTEGSPIDRDKGKRDMETMLQELDQDWPKMKGMKGMDRLKVHLYNVIQLRAAKLGIELDV